MSWTIHFATMVWRNMKKKYILLIIASATGLILAGCDWAKEAPAAESTPAIPVIATKPTMQDLTVYVDSIGTLLPSIFMEIRPQTNGTLSKVLVTEGQYVEEGTPLFLIDTKPYEIKVQEAQAQLAMDRAILDAAQKKLARFKQLAQKDLISQTEWDELEAEADRSKAKIDLDIASLESAKLDLEHCTLKSPVQGRIGRLDAHPGLLVAAGQADPLVTICKMDPLIIEFTVTEKEYPKIPQTLLPVEIQSLCNSGTCNQGTVTFLDNHFQTDTGLLLVRGTVPNPGHTMRPGQSVQVRVPVTIISNAQLIPQKSVRYNQEGPYVYVVKADMTVEQRQITVGEERGTDLIVLKGLDPSETIILDGHLRLSPGTKVEIKA